jgi:MFS superfamily sulfate permease-like transporter
MPGPFPSVDFTAQEKWRLFFQTLKDEGIELAIARAHLPLRDMHLNVGIEPIFSAEKMFVRVSGAVRAFIELQQNQGW